MRPIRTLRTRFTLSGTLRMARGGLCAGLVLATVGCQSMGLGTWKKPKLKEAVGANNEDPWTTQAGSEGRAGRTMEKEADPLNLRRFLMSEKAMEIERNCGFE